MSEFQVLFLPYFASFYAPFLDRGGSLVPPGSITMSDLQSACQTIGSMLPYHSVFDKNILYILLRGSWCNQNTVFIVHYMLLQVLSMHIR